MNITKQRVAFVAALVVSVLAYRHGVRSGRLLIVQPFGQEREQRFQRWNQPYRHALRQHGQGDQELARQVRH